MAQRSEQRRPTRRRAERPQGTARANGSRPAPAQQRQRHDAPDDAPRDQRPAKRPSGKNSKARSTIARWRSYGVAAFGAIMVLGCVIGLLFFLRPTVSTVEQRNLTAFPTFTPQTFLNGSFFTDLSLWYADTYPLREVLVQADHAIERTFGIQPKTQLVGGNVQADSIPVASDGSAGKGSSEPETREQVAPPDSQQMQADIQSNVMNGLYVDGDRACSMFYFNQSAVDSYCEAVSAYADKLDGTATVYSVLIPNNSGALLDEDVLASLGGSDQRQALEYYYSKMDERVKVVKTLDALREHRDEYIYFRTDHHWTELGAYYAYEQLCAKRGVDPAPIDTWKQDDYGPFLGTFYSELQLESMSANPDNVHVYIPTSTNDMTYWNTAGDEVQTNVVLDPEEAGYAENGMYLCFIAGDQPLSIIKNPTKNDGSACLFVKDSYGCAFAPLLVDDYETVYIVDFRSCSVNITEYVKEHGIQEVIFLNNMTIAGTEGVGETLMQYL